MPRAPRRSLSIFVDGRSYGRVSVAGHATERHKVLAAMRLPGVLDVLKRRGVAASTWSEGRYDILTGPKRRRKA